MNLQDCLDFLKHINRSFIVAWEGNTVLLKLHWAARLLIQPASSITPLSFSHSKLLHSPKTNWFCARRTQANTHAHTQRIVYIHAAALRAEGQDTSERVDGGDRESRTDNESWPKCEWKADGKEKKVKNPWGVDKKNPHFVFYGSYYQTNWQHWCKCWQIPRYSICAAPLWRFWWKTSRLSSQAA